MTLAKLLQVVAESDSLTDKISINFMRMAAYLLSVVLLFVCGSNAIHAKPDPNY